MVRVPLLWRWPGGIPAGQVFEAPVELVDIAGTEDGSVELFDLASDPGERNNLRDELPGKVEELAAHLEDWMRIHGRPGASQDEISDRDRERLEALGYVE